MRYTVIFYVPPLPGEDPLPDAHDSEDVDADSEDEAKAIIKARYPRVEINAAVLTTKMLL